MKLFLLVSALALSTVQASWWNSWSLMFGRRNKSSSGGNGNGMRGSGNTTVIPQSLEENEMITMLFMREEEKLARDVYLTFHEEYQRSVFQRIARSEQIHMDRMKSLIERYGLTDPISDDTIGVFSDEGLRALYDDLVEDGMVSELAALKVGGYIEELDIDDLNAAITETDKSDVAQVYHSLKQASYNHLRAFVDNIGSMGEEYIAQLLPQSVVDDILDGL